jgi:serine/threonine-protein kinase
MQLEPGTVVDRYEVVAQLGVGGMAVVYLVQHRMLHSEHVLKVLTVPGGHLTGRLIEEGRVQARLKHRNIVEVTDVVEVDGAPGLVMELVRGPSMDALLTGEPLPFALVDQLVPGILAGVSTAHQLGFVHRDLKPANVLLAIRRGRVVPKVADFGLVKRSDSLDRKTQSGTTMGTPHYMAPEQIQSARQADARSDIHALGVILYEMLAGDVPFTGEGTFEVFQAVVARDHQSLAERRTDVPPRMLRAVEAAMAPYDERPADCETLWRLWSGGTVSLEEAAVQPGTWEPELIERLASMSPVSITQSTSGSEQV